MIETEIELELERLKQKNRIEILNIKEKFVQKEHKRKIKRLDKLVKIAEKGLKLEGY